MHMNASIGFPLPSKWKLVVVKLHLLEWLWLSFSSFQLYLGSDSCLCHFVALFQLCGGFLMFHAVFLIISRKSYDAGPPVDCSCRWRPRSRVRHLQGNTFSWLLTVGSVSEYLSTYCPLHFKSEAIYNINKWMGILKSIDPLTVWSLWFRLLVLWNKNTWPVRHVQAFLFFFFFYFVESFCLPMLSSWKGDVRAVLKWRSKVITRLPLLRLATGLKISCQFFNQWKAKPKLIVPFTGDFSRALCKLRVRPARNSDWFV